MKEEGIYLNCTFIDGKELSWFVAIFPEKTIKYVTTTVLEMNVTDAKKGINDI